MNYQNETRMESLLNQLHLVEPTRRLDDSIASLASPAGMMTRPARRFSWTALASTAIAASLLGLVAGIATSGAKLNGASVNASTMHNVSATPMFLTMHGHSGNATFQDCSACHMFKSKTEQTVKKWLVNDSASDANLGLRNCSMCHLQKGQLLATELGSKG